MVPVSFFAGLILFSVHNVCDRFRYPSYRYYRYHGSIYPAVSFLIFPPILGAEPMAYDESNQPRKNQRLWKPAMSGANEGALLTPSEVAGRIERIQFDPTVLQIAIESFTLPEFSLSGLWIKDLCFLIAQYGVLIEGMLVCAVSSLARALQFNVCVFGSEIHCVRWVE